ncbi:MAG: hypothetical protein QXW86_11900, partial [Saccharolobus sp.]
LSPRLIVIQNKNNIWYVVTGYKVAFVDSQLKKIEKSFVNSDRMECSEIQEEYNTRICLNPS